MLKMVAGTPPNQVLAIGLSFNNLDEFKRKPNDTHIRIRGEDTGLAWDVILFSGEWMRATGNQGGRQVFMIGFTLEEIDLMRQRPGQTLLKLEKVTYHIPFDVLVFSGETEELMTHQFQELIGPETRVTISPRQKN